MTSKFGSIASGKPPSAGVRWEIQALRGWAIFLVVADHAKFPPFKGGFLGVDIFFVVSGFLMTGLILSAIDDGRFSLFDFYSRRIRRLMPAAYATILVTSVAGAILLDSHELNDLLWQVAGAFTFVINYVLWQQIDYFNSLAAMKPLLHLWSLSVEEQYYLFLPLFLYLIAKNLRVAFILIFTILSLALCFYMVERSPSAAFYFLPTRAWEMGFGSLLAAFSRKGDFRLPAGAIVLVRIISIATLIVAPMWFDASGHPGVAAVLVCAATAFLLALPCGVKHGPAWKIPIWIGDHSYSIYLLHWPLFAFVNNIFLHAPGVGVRLLLVFICLLLAELQYRYVETPFRRISLSKRYVALLLFIPVMTVGIICGALLMRKSTDEDFRAANVGLSRDCAYAGAFAAVPHCQSTPTPEIMVWGDSFAMHVIPAVASSTSRGVIQATQPVCGPFLGVAPMNGQQFKEAWAKRCISFNASVLDYLREHPEIRTVVLSSALVQYFSDPQFDWRLLKKEGDEYRISTTKADDFRASALATIAALRSLGKRVVMFGPPARSNFDIGRCLQRRMEDRLLFPNNATCDFPRTDFSQGYREIVAFVVELQQAAKLELIRIDDATCDETICHAMIDNVPLYRDEAHLSIPGSRWLGAKLGLKQRLDRE